MVAADWRRWGKKASSGLRLLEAILDKSVFEKIGNEKSSPYKPIRRVVICLIKY